jgi:hypothetical protein
MRGLSANPELAMLLSDYLAGKLAIEAASPVEKSQLRSHFYMRRADLDNKHYQFRNGLISK